jgi:hypothetical protein
VDGPPPENCHRRQLWPKAAAVATHKSDVLDEVTERRLTWNLRIVNALTDPTVLEPVIAGVTEGSEGRARCRRSGACPWGEWGCRMDRRDRGPQAASREG